MHRGRLALVPFLLGVVLFADARVARAQTAADLFDPGVLQEMKLFINSRDLALLNKNYLDNTYYPADLEWRGTRVRNVAVRSRGAGSRYQAKMSFRVDFNRYAKGQQLAGQNAIDLRNLIQDESMMREFVSMAFFARMGQPASRESYCRLTVNGVFMGLYTIVEEVDENYLKRTLNENAGYLFEYHWLAPFFFTYPGDDLALYKPILEAKTHALEPDAIVYGPIRDLFREVNGPLDAVWRDRVQALIDLNQFVTYVAIENFMAEYDGMTGNFGMNNFYLYRSGATTPHRVIVWDRSESFRALDSDIFARTDLNVLFARVMTYPDLRTLYLDVLQQCADSATADGWLATQVQQVAALISDTAHQDTGKVFSNAEFDAAIQFMLDFSAFRPGFVTKSVALARGPLPQ